MTKERFVYIDLYMIENIRDHTLFILYYKLAFHTPDQYSSVYF